MVIPACCECSIWQCGLKWLLLLGLCDGGCFGRRGRSLFERLENVISGLLDGRSFLSGRVIRIMRRHDLTSSSVLPADPLDENALTWPIL